MDSHVALNEILQEFQHIAEIPRPSHHEEKIGAYLAEWAQKHRLTVTKDSIGDIIIDKPASPGCEKAPKVILQAHMDMVCVAAEGVEYEPLRDSIKVVNDGKYLRADGTSLGADDGIGVALCLYLLQDDSFRHGPLRVIITVNEEDGMDSIAMPGEFLDGDYLINLDWESLGSLCNSAAGCDFMQFTRNISMEQALPGQTSMRIVLKGLQGGHSGVGINLGRANALVSLATFLMRLKEKGIPFQIADFSGGQAKNAIPATAQVTIAVHASQCEKVNEALEAYKQDFLELFGPKEPTCELFIETSDPVTQVIDQESTEKMLALMTSLPNGVNTMSPFADGLVESSQNLGVLIVQNGQICLEAMERSCVNYRAEEILRADRLIANAFGFAYVQGEHAPAWAVNPNSKLVPLTCEAYKTLTGSDMVVEPVHGGLECGAFFEKNPHLDMIAIGPTLENVHSPDETCEIESIRITLELLVEVLTRLSSL